MSLTATVSSPIASLSIVRPNEQCLKQHQNVWSSSVGLKSFSFKQQKNVWSSPVGLKSLSLKQHKNVWSSPVGLKPLCKQLKPFESKRSITRGSRLKHASFICAAALNATCAAEQTQTVTRQSSTITVAPIQGKEKSPDLDDGGDGFPPRDDGDGGGGGGGGGHWSGGFFFFGFLAFLGLLKDKESEGPYDDRRRR